MVLPVHRLRMMYMTYVVAAEVVPVPAQLGVEGTARPQLHALRTWQASCSGREPQLSTRPLHAPYLHPAYSCLEETQEKSILTKLPLPVG